MDKKVTITLRGREWFWSADGLWVTSGPYGEETVSMDWMLVQLEDLI